MILKFSDFTTQIFSERGKNNHDFAYFLEISYTTENKASGY